MQRLLNSEQLDISLVASSRWPGNLAVLLEVAKLRGASSARVLSGTGLTEFDLADPACLIARETELRTIDNFVGLFGDVSGLGIEVGSRCRFTTFGPLGIAMVSSANLMDATQLVLNYAELFDPFVSLLLERDHGHLGVIVRPELVPRRLAGFVMERAVAALVFTWRSITGRAVLPSDTAFTFNRPTRADLYSQVLGTQVKFAAPHTRVSLQVDELKLPLPSSDSYACGSAEENCKRMRIAARAPLNVTRRVKTLVRARLDEMPEMENVAASLCMSVRTLRRRLQIEDTTFSALCEEIRKSEAEQLLSGGHLPLVHIAERLGYAQSTGFINAFKRWNGLTPGAFRSTLPSNADY